MNLTESFLTALDSLFANKLRAILTMLGVIIGVAAVIALMGIGNGFSEFVSGEINSIGTNLIYITTDSENSNGYPALSMSDVTALSDTSRAPCSHRSCGSGPNQPDCHLRWWRNVYSCYRCHRQLFQPQ